MQFTAIILALGLALGASAAPVYCTGHSVNSTAASGTFTSEVPVATYVDGFKRDVVTKGDRLAARTASRTWVGKFRRVEQPADEIAPDSDSCTPVNQTVTFTGGPAIQFNSTDSTNSTGSANSTSSDNSTLPSGLDRLQHAGVNLGAFIGFRR